MVVDGELSIGATCKGRIARTVYMCSQR
jgi:hypothetical protein